MTAARAPTTAERSLHALERVRRLVAAAGLCLTTARRVSRVFLGFDVSADPMPLQRQLRTP